MGKNIEIFCDVDGVVYNLNKHVIDIMNDELSMDYDYKQAKVSETQYSTPTTNLIATSKNSSKPLYSQKRIARLTRPSRSDFRVRQGNHATALHHAGGNVGVLHSCCTMGCIRHRDRTCQFGCRGLSSRHPESIDHRPRRTSRKDHCPERLTRQFGRRYHDCAPW